MAENQKSSVLRRGHVEVTPVHVPNHRVSLGVIEQREHRELGQLETPFVEALGLCAAFGKVEFLVETRREILGHEASSEIQLPRT